jgi:prephenate dehydrogenase
MLCGTDTYGVGVLEKDGTLRPICRKHQPRVPEELLPAYGYEEELVLPDVSVEAVKVACQRAVLEHIQRCLVLLHPLAGPRVLNSERTEEQLVAREAYTALHNVEKDWLRRLGKPALTGGSSADTIKPTSRKGEEQR